MIIFQVDLMTLPTNPLSQNLGVVTPTPWIDAYELNSTVIIDCFTWLLSTVFSSMELLSCLLRSCANFFEIAFIKKCDWLWQKQAVGQKVSFVHFYIW